ncbi:MAG: hypothetical protein F8N37_14590 [Telmatospirillum sp.]|nr:hypothetical protein [Telmatospirillum sp.]
MHETVINCLAIMGAIAWMSWLIRNLNSATAQEGKASPVTTIATTTITRGAPIVEPLANNDDIAVIAAAVNAVLGSCRIVHIEDSDRGRRWAAEGRRLHQNSHRIH